MSKSTQVESNKLYLLVSIATRAHATCGQTVTSFAGHVGVLLTSEDEKQERIKANKGVVNKSNGGFRSKHLHSDITQSDDGMLILCGREPDCNGT